MVIITLLLQWYSAQAQSAMEAWQPRAHSNLIPLARTAVRMDSRPALGIQFSVNKMEPGINLQCAKVNNKLYCFVILTLYQDRSIFFYVAPLTDHKTAI